MSTSGISSFAIASADEAGSQVMRHTTCVPYRPFISLTSEEEGRQSKDSNVRSPTSSYLSHPSLGKVPPPKEGTTTGN